MLGLLNHNFWCKKSTIPISLMVKSPYVCLLKIVILSWFPSLPPCKKTVPALLHLTLQQQLAGRSQHCRCQGDLGATHLDGLWLWTKTLVLYPKVAWLIEGFSLPILKSYILTLDPSAYSKPQKRFVSNKQSKSGQYPSQCGNMSHS